MNRHLGIDIGGTAIKWALVTDDFEIVERGEVPTKFTSSDEVVEAIASVAHLHASSFASIGVSAPGLIYEDDADGTIHHGGALTYMDGCPIGRILHERFDVPVAVRNDGKSAAMGEYAAGALRGAKVGVVMAIGTGIGGGIVIDGNLLHGTRCFAGEFSMIRCDITRGVSTENTFSEQCGWLGLRRFVLAEKGLTDDPAFQNVDGRTIFEWIDDGDEDARRGLQRHASMFTAELFNLQTVLDPDVFAIGGGISCHDALLHAINAALTEQRKQYVGPMEAMPMPKVVRAELGNDASLYGAVQEAKKLLQ